MVSRIGGYYERLNMYPYFYIISLVILAGFIITTIIVVKRENKRDEQLINGIKEVFKDAVKELKDGEGEGG